MALIKMQHHFQAMGGPCEINLYINKNQQHILFELEEEVRRLEKKYSRYLDNSIIQKINHAQGNKIKVDIETAGLLNYASNCYKISDGLFDITSGVLRRAWDFKNKKLPSQESINQLLNRIGWHKVLWDGKTIQLGKNMEIDFGGVGKEYAVDVLARICQYQNIEHGLINLSGDIRVLGAHPNGEPWRVGIQHPREKNTAIASIDLFQGALASSGDYERFFMHDSTRYCHVLNPLTGWPAQYISGVSIQTDECLVAGSLSTIAMLKEREAVSWLSDIGCEYLLIDSQMKIHKSFQGSSD